MPQVAAHLPAAERAVGGLVKHGPVHVAEHVPRVVVRLPPNHDALDPPPLGHVALAVRPVVVHCRALPGLPAGAVQERQRLLLELRVRQLGVGICGRQRKRARVVQVRARLVRALDAAVQAAHSTRTVRGARRGREALSVLAVALERAWRGEPDLNCRCGKSRLRA